MNLSTLADKARKLAQDIERSEDKYADAGDVAELAYLLAELAGSTNNATDPRRFER